MYSISITKNILPSNVAGIYKSAGGTKRSHLSHQPFSRKLQLNLKLINHYHYKYIHSYRTEALGANL
jgi:hypothetical protein